MAGKRKLRFEVSGLAWWAYGRDKFEAGVHEPVVDRKLERAIRDAAAAGVGVRLLKR